jgi:hypothetical protein
MSSRENEVAKEPVHFVQSNVLSKEHQVLLVLHENNGLGIRHYDTKLYGEHQMELLLTKLIMCFNKVAYFNPASEQSRKCGQVILVTYTCPHVNAPVPSFVHFSQPMLSFDWPVMHVTQANSATISESCLISEYHVRRKKSHYLASAEVKLSLCLTN